MKILSLALIFAVTTAHASRVAVVDSGTDFAHTMIKNNVFTNSGEIPGNRIDDDHNGKVDDVHGWNFIAQSNKVFSIEHLQSINPIVYPLIRVVAHKQAGTITATETQFLQDNVLSLAPDQKAKLLAHLNYFGEYVHSTHVSGIVIQQNPLAQIMSAKVFPDEPPPVYNTPEAPAPALHHALWNPIDWLYGLFAAVANGSFKSVASYLQEMKMDVANYSLGMSLSNLAKTSLGLRGNSAPTADELAAEVRRLYAPFDFEGRAWMATSPNTLFVIAAGNDGTDNDVLPAFPGNVRVDNAICVAATLGYQKIAFFSNFGATTVDVAAPGVSVLSSVPSLDQTAELPLSGTSMAAPFVTGVASRVKDANPALTPKQIRQILMETVDVKDWLAGKVVSSGIVNADRAAAAATLSLVTDVDSAITQARATIVDKAEMTNGPQSEGLTPMVDNEINQLARQLVF